jgi:hypothetical protein
MSSTRSKIFIACTLASSLAISACSNSNNDEKKQNTLTASAPATGEASNLGNPVKNLNVQECPQAQEYEVFYSACQLYIKWKIQVFLGFHQFRIIFLQCRCASAR